VKLEIFPLGRVASARAVVNSGSTSVVSTTAVRLSDPIAFHTSVTTDSSSRLTPLTESLTLGVRPLNVTTASFGCTSIAASSAADAFDCAFEACRIAVEYMTPVILLSDNYIANGSEPWKLPDLEKLPSFTVRFHTETENFEPFGRNEKLARPWVKPGTPGLQHRIGGLEKENLTGNISYDPDNHELMTRLRQEKVFKVRESIPTPEVDGPEHGDLLVVGWGGTKGGIKSASDTVRAKGLAVANMHMRHLWPLPNGLDAIFSRFKAILVPELNMGQLWRVLRSEYPQHNFISYPKVQGRPFRSSELVDRIQSILEQ